MIRRRGKPRACGVPTRVGISAHATNEYREIWLDAGMTEYLTKPVELEKLRNLIAELSSRSLLLNLNSSLATERRGQTEDSTEKPRLV
ncbi:MAG: hypothetical protein ABSB35_06410 [Bryobacteraceae bacterium]|jgi:CheY-like chemotaxis protein